MKSFYENLAEALLPDVATALRLDPATVYSGRAPQRIQRQGFEVWVVPTAIEGQVRTRLHTIELHLRFKTRREGNLTGTLQLMRVLERLDLLRDRYDGARPFAATLPALVALEAEVAALDQDPEDPEVLDGTLRLKALERIS